jgi:hypothetical protein
MDAPDRAGADDADGERLSHEQRPFRPSAINEGLPSTAGC